MANLIEVGIDYITITEKDSNRWNELVSTVERFIAPQMLENGHTWSGTRALGYKGVRLGTMFLGSRADSSMLRVSGPLAHVVFNELRMRHTGLHVTRLDLQCTIAFEADRMLYAEECKAQALYHQEKAPKGSHPGITLISTNGRGDTLQIGARSSEVFCRVYDKWREQALDYQPYTWRFEVECKGSAAEKAIAVLSRSEGLQDDIQGMVRGTFEARGIVEPCLMGMRAHTLKGEKSKTDDEKKMNWLRSHVRATVQRLIAHGYQDEVLDALGVDMV